MCSVGGIIDKGKNAIGTAISSFNGNFNVYTTLGVFAMGWLFSRSLKPPIYFLSKYILG